MAAICAKIQQHTILSFATVVRVELNGEAASSAEVATHAAFLTS